MLQELFDRIRGVTGSDSGAKRLHIEQMNRRVVFMPLVEAVAALNNHLAGLSETVDWAKNNNDLVYSVALWAKLISDIYQESLSVTPVKLDTDLTDLKASITSFNNLLGISSNPKFEGVVLLIEEQIGNPDRIAFYHEMLDQEGIHHLTFLSLAQDLRGFASILSEIYPLLANHPIALSANQVEELNNLLNSFCETYQHSIISTWQPNKPCES